MLYTVKQLVGKNGEGLGKWIKVTPEEFSAIEESMVGENYARGAVNKESLRLYHQDGYAVVCTKSVEAEPHPTAFPPKPVEAGRSDSEFIKDLSQSRL